MYQEHFAWYMILHRQSRQRLNDRIEIRGPHITQIDPRDTITTRKHPLRIYSHMHKCIVFQIWQEKFDFVLNRRLPNVKIQKQDQLILLTEVNIGLDRLY